MLIALLAVLGVDLIVVVALLAGVISRKRWVKRQTGVFQGAIRVVDGEIEGLSGKWKRGYGRWVRDVLAWTKGPLLFRNELVLTDRITGERPAGPEELKRLGREPIVIELTAGGAKVEVAASAEHRDLIRPPDRAALSEHG